jgi:hypothetical protein
MNCSHTIRSLEGGFRTDGFSWNAQSRRGAAIMAYLKALVTPEPSNEAEPLPELPTDRLFGALKTSLWASAAIGLGVVLATLCS